MTLGDAAGSGTIVVDDEPPVLSVANVTVTEGPSVEGVFTVALSAESGFGVTVDYATAGDTAASGLDFESTAAGLSFPAGTTNRTVAVAIVDDLVDEPSETFLLSLANADHAVLPAGRTIPTFRAPRIPRSLPASATTTE